MLASHQPGVGSKGLSSLVGRYVDDGRRPVVLDGCLKPDREEAAAAMALAEQGARHASPYATGGGGTVLEHAYGGVLLAALLLGEPVSGLGDDVTPVEIRFQQGSVSPVDDLVVVGVSPAGMRMMFVGVRRNPTVGAGSASFVKLMVDYLRMVVDHRAELDAGRWRLGLAVAGPHTAAREVAELARIARRQRDNGAFRAAVAAPSATTGRVRARLRNVDEVVSAAMCGIAPGDDGAGDELAWRLLQALRVIDLRLEGDDAVGQTGLVARLVPLVGDTPRADELRRRLTELAAGYAQAAATVDKALLGRDLASYVLIGPPQ
jgi:hypothetical protein